MYGNGDWLIPLNEFVSDHALERVKLMIKQQQNIRTYLAQRIPEIQQDAYKAIQRLKEILEGKEASRGKGISS